MDALDIITLEYAKDQVLDVDFDEKDEFIEDCIKAAVAWVEQYTSHMLYEREVVFHTNNKTTKIPYTPVVINTVKNDAGTALDYKLYPALSGNIYLKACAGVTVTATAGYSEADIDKIPGTLISAACKLLTYLYENHTVYAANVPLDIQILINPYRRTIL